MRHIASLVAGLLIAPLAWVLLAAGQTGSINVVDAWGHGSAHPVDLLRPALCLVAAGLLLGLIVSLRVSPVGPLVAGVGYAAVYLAMIFKSSAVHDTMPGQFTAFGQPVDPQIPLDNGTVLLLGTILIMAVVSPGRWRRWPRPETAASGEAVPTDAVPAQRADADDTLAPTSPAPTSPAPTSPAPVSPAPTSPAPTSPAPGGPAPAGPAPAPVSGALTGTTPNPFAPRRMPTVASKLPRRPVRRPAADSPETVATPGTAQDPSTVTPPEWPPPSTSGADPASGTGASPADPASTARGAETDTASTATVTSAPTQPTAPRTGDADADADAQDPTGTPRPHRSPWIAPPGGTDS
ncbi:MAG TPA: hypothetical protein VF054_03320 [Micromonosporaceae bacterium]